uniref:Caffeic acid O-methyltransferase-like protein n=1 Tax=Narcissus tazetta TaxID=54860 RepID=M9T2E5_NARTA|nr:caffeic acid O-methyltransferase-like protein [Narcissus tazetta]AGI97942.1 caffeic acid O-methyltransferase-like protein [Narcissus tazetta]
MGSCNINDDEAFTYAAQLLSLSALPMTLAAAVELNLFDIITKAGPNAYLPVSEIVAKLPTENPQASEMFDRMLRLLAGFDVVTFKSVTMDETSGRMERRYGANNVTKYFCKDEGGDGCSLAPGSKLFHDHTTMEAWYNLKNAVLDGGDPFSKAHGMNIFEFAKANPRFNSLFNEGMKGYSCIIMKKVLDVSTAFDDLNVLVDVGGGTGGTLGAIIARHPHIKGINYDLPHVIREAPSFPGIEHIGGDMFKSIPSGDAILLKTLCCDWDDEHVLKLLKNCWKALPDNGKVIIIDDIFPMIVEEESTNSLEKFALLIDLITLVHVPSGKERTEEEFWKLAKSAGFSRFGRVGNCAVVTIMEFYK